jgi:hypothetical protein
MKLSISKNVHLVEPGDFEPSDHWYPRVLNSNIHPMVAFFLNLSHKQMIERYKRLKPKVNSDHLLDILTYQPKYFRWAGSDLMYVLNREGEKSLTLIETNSCPSGQKSMPLLDQSVEQGGYKRLIENTFKPMVSAHSMEGVLAVVYDKNPMENIGYAATIADSFREDVYLAQFNNKDLDPPIRFENDQMQVRIDENRWLPVRAAFRYVTQEPWNRLPLNTNTLILNPIQACLAGGRNKEIASIAYEDFNQKFHTSNLRIHTPRTIRNVGLSKLPDYFKELNGNFVIKLPDSNAGQGVYTITSEKEFSNILKKLEADPERTYLLQELIAGNFLAGSGPGYGNYAHIGTIPDSKNRIFAFDIRLMIQSTDIGFRPIAGYSRRSRYPLNQPLPENLDSWDVYGTNLSVKSEQGWEYDDARLMIFDIRNFANLGLGLDDLIEGFIQTCQAVYAIDNNAKKIYDKGN